MLIRMCSFHSLFLLRELALACTLSCLGLQIMAVEANSGIETPQSLFKGKRFFLYTVIDPPFEYPPEDARKGFMNDLAMYLSRKYGFQYEVTDQSLNYNDAFREVTSGRAANRTSCKSQNCIPITWAAHWLTKFRMERATSFTQSYLDRGISLLVKIRRRDADFINRVLLLWRPFTLRVWLLLGCLILLGALVWFLGEYLQHRVEERQVPSYWLYVYNVFVALCSARDSVPINAPSRVFVVGLAIVATMFTAMYTAGLVRQLDGAGAPIAFSRFEQLLNDDSWACVGTGSAIKGVIREHYPELQVRDVADYKSGVKAVREETCDGLVYDELINLWQAGKDTDCVLRSAERSSLLALPYVFFLDAGHVDSDAARLGLTIAIAETRANGMMDQIYKKHFDSGQVHCSASQERVPSLDIAEASGLLTSFLLFTLASFCCMLFGGRVARSWARLQNRLCSVSPKTNTNLHKSIHPPRMSGVVRMMSGEPGQLLGNCTIAEDVPESDLSAENWPAEDFPVGDLPELDFSSGPALTKGMDSEPVFQLEL